MHERNPGDTTVGIVANTDDHFVMHADVEDVERVGYFRTNVLAPNFTNTNITYGYNHISNGRFHFLNMGIGASQGLLKGACTFKIMGVANTIIASMTIASNSRIHTPQLPGQPFDTVLKAITNARNLLITGALGGYDIERIRGLFCRFSLIFTSSRGGHNQDVIEDHGMQFYKWTVGPFDIGHLLSHDPQTLHRLIMTVEAKMEEILTKAADFGISEDADNSDIQMGFNNLRQQYALAYNEKHSALHHFRLSLFHARIDETTFKFLPRSIRQPNTHTIHPLSYNTAAIPLNASITDLTPLPFLGDAADLRLRTEYSRLAVGEDQYRNLNGISVNNSHTLAESSLPLPLYDEFDVQPSNQLIVIKGYYELNDYAIEVMQNPSATLSATDVQDRITPHTPAVRQPITLNVHNHFFQPISEETFDRIHHQPVSSDSDSEDQSSGCRPKHKDCVEAYFTRLSNFKSPRDADDNDCFLRCLFMARGEPEDTEAFAAIREVLEMTKDAHFRISNLQPLSTATNEVYHIWNIVDTDYESLKENHPGLAECKISKMFKKAATITPKEDSPEQKRNRKHIHFLWYREHSYLIKDPSFVVDKVKCGKCTQWSKMGSFKNHYDKCNYCNICRKAFSTKNGEHQCQGERLLPKENTAQQRSLAQEKVCEDWVPTRKYHLVKKLTKESLIWFADIETFPNPHEGFNCTSYAIGVQCLEVGSKYHYFWGEDAMKDFLGMKTVKRRFLYKLTFI